jgi:hypothetical protein
VAIFVQFADPAMRARLFADVKIVELRKYEATLAEGIGHCGRSALVGVVAVLAQLK